VTSKFEVIDQVPECAVINAMATGAHSEGFRIVVMV
jgi:hypothetical protein